MKRYKIHYGIMIKDDEGGWVEYEDVFKFADGLFKYTGKLSAKLSAQSEPPTECNCAEKSTRARERVNILLKVCVGPAIPKRRLRPHWICPMHGYKRL